MWLIPVKEIKGIKNSIKLRTESTSNGQGFQTYSYRITL